MESEKQKKMRDIGGRRRREGVRRSLFDLPDSWQAQRMMEPILPMRVGFSAEGLSEHLTVAVTPAVKNEFTRVARELRVSRAELGLILVQHALRNLKWVHAAVRAYARGCRRWRGVSMAELRKLSKRVKGGRR